MICRAAASLCLALLLGASAAGCATVAPYEREYLSKPSMDPSAETREFAFRAHVRDAREGATGGDNSTGGGCGCN